MIDEAVLDRQHCHLPVIAMALGEFYCMYKGDCTYSMYAVKNCRYCLT